MCPRRVLQIDETSQETGSGGVTPSPWGTPVVDPAVAGVPATPEAQAVTQATQSANEAERAAAALSQLPPPPFGVPFTDEKGFVSKPWMPWMTQVWRRGGGSIVTPAADVDVLTEFDDLPEPIRDAPVLEWADPAPRLAADVLEWAEPAPRPAAEVLDWMGSLEPTAQVAMLAQQVDVLTALVLSIREQGWNRQAAMTAAAAAAPAGGVGTAAGGWDTAVSRDAAIATLNNLRTRMNEVEVILQNIRAL